MPQIFLSGKAIAEMVLDDKKAEEAESKATKALSVRCCPSPVHEPAVLTIVQDNKDLESKVAELETQAKAATEAEKEKEALAEKVEALEAKIKELEAAVSAKAPATTEVAEVDAPKETNGATVDPVGA